MKVRMQDGTIFETPDPTVYPVGESVTAELDDEGCVVAFRRDVHTFQFVDGLCFSPYADGRDLFADGRQF